MANWTIDDVAARFEEAVTTERRLPPVRVQGYFNCWPAVVRNRWEAFAADEKVYRFPPSPEDIDRMMETIEWVKWLEIEQRHLVWMRAKRHGWRDISIRFACNRTTAWRRWQKALETVTARLNARGSESGGQNMPPGRTECPRMPDTGAVATTLHGCDKIDCRPLQR